MADGCSLLDVFDSISDDFAAYYAALFDADTDDFNNEFSHCGVMGLLL